MFVSFDVNSKWPLWKHNIIICLPNRYEPRRIKSALNLTVHSTQRICTYRLAFTGYIMRVVIHNVSGSKMFIIIIIHSATRYIVYLHPR